MPSFRAHALTQSIVPHRDNIDDWKILLRYLQDLDIKKNAFWNAIVTQIAENIRADSKCSPDVISIELRIKEE